MISGRRLKRLGALIVVAGFVTQALSLAWAVATNETRPWVSVRMDQIQAQEVVFRNPEAGLRLAGLLFPAGGTGPRPAAVIIPGSGESRRDNGWYLTFASGLQSRGLTVLVPDKRGSGASEGDWRSASFDDLATDARAAIHYLASRPDVDADRLGIVGMSQGGHIAPLVAGGSDAVDFVVSVVGGAVPMHELLVFEEYHNLRGFGVLPGFAHVMAPLTSWLIRHGGQSGFWNAVGNFDPLPHWRDVEQPALILYGELDTNVPSARSAALLRALGKSNLEIRIYEGSGHALEDPPERGHRVFREDALQDIYDFITVGY